jgi:hypothetical protein
VLLLSGCLRFTSDLTVSENDTVSGQYVVAVPTGTGDSLGMSDRDVAEELWGDTDLGDRLGDASIDGYREGEWSGIVVRFSDQPLAAFAPGDDHWGITRSGDEYVVSGVVSGGTVDSVEPQEGEVAPDVKVTLTFPGPVTQANGTITGRTVTWVITEENTALTARAATQPEPDRARTLAFLVTSILGIAAVAYWWAGRVGAARRQMQPARGTIKE